MDNDTYIKIDPGVFSSNDNMSNCGNTIDLSQISGSITIDTSNTIDLSGAYYSYNNDANTIDITTINTSAYNYNGPSREEYQQIFNRLDKLEKVLLEEVELREKHPAVKQAYEEYKLLATLAKSHSFEVDEDVDK
mgnify:CR=1 FL=1